MITKPMLAVKCTDPSALRFPVLATPKIDGIRCLKIAGHAVSRAFKPIPNAFIRGKIEASLPDGVDGEIVIPGLAFSQESSIIMSVRHDGETEFIYCVFDYVSGGGGETNHPYEARMAALAGLAVSPFVRKVLPVLIRSAEELAAFEGQCVATGYEGAMIRSPDGPYKCGRATEREGYLLKIKRFEDAEARVVGFVEKRRNENEAVRDAVGAVHRSGRQGGLRAAGTLGALLVSDLATGRAFQIGSGFDAETRSEIWGNQAANLGQIVKYKHQPYGAQDRPRFSTFVGFRHENDM